MSDQDKLTPSRIVYHRGSVVYARLRTGGPDDLRHPLDVPNGAGCGCVCDECNEQLLGCANDSAKVAAGLYKKIPYFAHQSNTQCAPSGERGLMEAFRLVLNSQPSFCLPEARYSSGSGAVDDVIYRTSVSVAVNSFILTPKVSGAPYELLLKTVQGDYRLLVVTKKSGAAVFEALRQQSIPVLVASMIPDYEGIIYMRDVLNTVQRGDNLAWVSLPEMDAHAADQRKLRETEEKRIRQVEDEKQERIRIREGIAKADADMQMKERSRQMDEEAKRLGMIKLLCAACKIETRFGSPEGDWAACPECKRFTSFWPLPPPAELGEKCWLAVMRIKCAFSRILKHFSARLIWRKIKPYRATNHLTQFFRVTIGCGALLIHPLRVVVVSNASVSFGD